MDAEQTSLFAAVLIASIVVFVIVGFFIAMIIRQQRKNKELYRSKVLAEISTMEKERSRIAADLHDELGPILSSVKLRMNCLDIESQDDHVEMEKINGHIDDIIKRMREISNDLMPSVLARKGLIPAMREFIGNISKPSNLEIQFHNEHVPDLRSEMAIHLYRMFQEIIHNTIKYSEATELKIGLGVRTTMLVFSSRDNGKGFDYRAALKEGGGFGLRNLLSRTEILNGEMFIETKPGKGTEYIFEIPLNFIV